MLSLARTVAGRSSSGVLSASPAVFGRAPVIVSLRLFSVSPEAQADTLRCWRYTADYVNPPGSPARFDHTYVKASTGKTWKCHGGDRGGTKLRHAWGAANMRFAKCLGRGESGIVYGVMGICHQIASRVLYAAKTTALAADGAVATSAFYGGTYGWPKNWKIRLGRCVAERRLPLPRIPRPRPPRIPRPRLPRLSSLVTVPEFAAVVERIPDDLVSEFEDVNVLGVEQSEAYRLERERFMLLQFIYLSSLTPEEMTAADLEVNLRFILGDRLGDTQMKELARAQAETRVEHFAICAPFFVNKEGRLAMPVAKVRELAASDPGYLGNTGRVVTDFFSKAERILGASKYADVFGEVSPPDTPKIIRSK